MNEIPNVMSRILHTLILRTIFYLVTVNILRGDLTNMFTRSYSLVKWAFRLQNTAVKNDLCFFNLVKVSIFRCTDIYAESFSQVKRAERPTHSAGQ